MHFEPTLTLYKGILTKFCICTCAICLCLAEMSAFYSCAKFDFQFWRSRNWCAHFQNWLQSGTGKPMVECHHPKKVAESTGKVTACLWKGRDEWTSYDAFTCVCCWIGGCLRFFVFCIVKLIIGASIFSGNKQWNGNQPCIETSTNQ